MIKANGTYTQVVEQISNEMELPQELTAAVLAYIINNPEILSDDEVIEAEDLNGDNQHGYSNLLLGDGKYYVLIKEILIILVCFLLTEKSKELVGLDISNISVPAFIGYYKDFRGGTFSPPFGKIEEENGVKCILKEVIKNRKGHVTAEILSKMIGAHCDKEYKCKYKTDGYCSCNEQNIRDILAHLEKKRILYGDNVIGYNVNW